jgi:transglutaminase-like putative cysteine protease
MVRTFGPVGVLFVSSCLLVAQEPRLPEGGAPAGYGAANATFDVEHSLVVKDIPAGAKRVRVWFWFPSDDDYQKVRDVSVSAPGKFHVTRDKEYGHQYLYAEIDSPGATATLSTHFIVQRREASFQLDPEKAGPLTDNHRLIFAEYLRKDCPCMEVSDDLAKLAQDICGEESNVVRQARQIFDWVVANTEHYSKTGAPKSSGLGSALYCLKNKGGGCTDQHALFIALARARGIPTRLHFGSILREKNEGKDHNPGYRCWVQYFVPGYGWVSTDASEADIQNKGDYYFSNLDERHIRFCEGRNLELNPPQTGARINLFLFAHVEVDGKTHAAFDRVLRFKSLR